MSISQYTTEYLRKHQILPLQIRDLPDPDLALVVTIPSHDEPDLLRTLESVSACPRPQDAVEVIVGLNLSECSSSEQRARYKRYLTEAQAFAAKYSARGYRIHVLDYPKLPKRHAGVGLARRLIMDEAVARLCAAGNDDGIIACLDADCTVASDYLQQLLLHFRTHPRSPACSIHYEHSLHGDDNDRSIRAGIVRYELYLRYYVHALRYAGFPYAFQTLGSSMAVRSDVYQREGGMNRRQAGEDFYFLSKVIALGGFSELRNTTVYPSPRVSHRVPFGTGRAMGEWIARDQSDWLVYPLAAFESVRSLCPHTARLWYVPSSDAAELAWIYPALAQYLDENHFREQLARIRANAASAVTFEKHFFRWFNGLRILKFLHWLRAQGQVQSPIESAAAELLRRAGRLESTSDVSAESLLRHYRRLDRNGDRLRFN